MKDSRGFLHPETLSRIQRLELRARSVVEGILSGNHRSPFFGQSVEFAQHRPYVPGDDLRHVDWKVWARQDRLYVKQFEEETDLRCSIVLDVSPSMNYGRGPLNKLEYAATLAASLAWLIQRQQDAIGLLTFDQEIRSQLSQRTSSSALQQMLATIETDVLQATQTSRTTSQMAQAEADMDVEPIFRQVASAFPRRGLCILVSDLLMDLDSLQKGLRGLSAAGTEILVLHLLDDDELDFPFDRPSQFEGLEMDGWVRCHPKELRDGYLAEVQEYLEQIHKIVSAYDIDYQMIRTSESLAGAISAFLSRRTRRLGR